MMLSLSFFSAQCPIAFLRWNALPQGGRAHPLSLSLNHYLSPFLINVEIRKTGIQNFDPSADTAAKSRWIVGLGLSSKPTMRLALKFNSKVYLEGRTPSHLQPLSL